MKLKILSALLATLMLCTFTLTSCFDTDGTVDVGVIGETTAAGDDAEAPEGDGNSSKDPYAMDASIPYVITYTSNGNGMCTVTDIKINSAYKQGFELVIPEKSPAGDTVTAIDLDDCFDHVVGRIPSVITKEAFEALISKVEATNPTSSDKFFLQKIKAYYVLQDANAETSPEAKAEMLRQFPIASYFPVYVLDTSTAPAEAAAIARFLDKYDAASLAYDEYQSIISLLKNKGLSDEQVNALCDMFKKIQYGNCTVYLQAISFPATLKSIDAGSFDNLCLSSDENMSFGADSFTAEADIDSATLLEIIKIGVPVYSKATELPAHWNTELTDMFNNAWEGWHYQYLMLYSETKPQNANDLKKYWCYVDGAPTSWRTID